MATLYITEYATLGSVLGGVANIAPGVALVDPAPVTIAGASAQSAAFNASTRYVRLHTDAICSIAFGADPTATTASRRMAADQTEYFAVEGGHKVAVITNA